MAAIPLLVLPLLSTFAPCIGLCIDEAPSTAAGPSASSGSLFGGLTHLQQNLITVALLGEVMRS